MKIFFYTFLYFCSSLLLSFFSSYFFSKNEYNFPYPIFVTGCQYLSQFLICKVLIVFIENISNKTDLQEIKAIELTKEEIEMEEEKVRNIFLIKLLNLIEFIKQYIKKMDYKRLCCSIVSSLDISLSVYSLKTTSLAFYTMIKSSSPVFILLNCFIFNIEEPSVVKLVIIFLISSGIFMTTINDSSMNPVYPNSDNIEKDIEKDIKNMNDIISEHRQIYILLFASFVSGFRWALIQYLLQENEEQTSDNKNKVNITEEININIQEEIKEEIEMKKHMGNHYTISILNKIQDLALPISLFLFTTSVVFEKPQKQIFEACNMRVISYSCILSVILIISEFMLVGFSSVMYLSLAGIVKEIFIIIYSVIFKGLRFSRINSFGLFISIVGILLFCMKHKID